VLQSTHIETFLSMDTNAGLPLESKHDFYVKKVPLGSWGHGKGSSLVLPSN